MTTAPLQALPTAQRRRLIAIGLLRAAAATTVLVAAYYLAPLDRLADLPLWLSLVTGLLLLAAIAAYQVRMIIRAEQPAVRGIEALATTAPLFLLLFAATYFVMAQSDAANFSEAPLTRTDTLYFTVTIFSTVGFGDITATGQTARVIVITQMLLNLLVLGLGIRVFLEAVQTGHRLKAERSEEDPS